MVTGNRLLRDTHLTDMAWLPDGSGLCAASSAGVLHRLDAQGDQRRQWQAHRGGVTRVCPRPGTDMTLASAGEDGRVLLWDARNGASLAVLAEGSDAVAQLAWTPDGQILAAAARKTISLWRGTETIGVWYDARRQVLAIAWDPDSCRLAGAANQGLYLWQLDQGGAGDCGPVQVVSLPGAPMSVAWRPEGCTLAAGTQDGFVQVWQPAAGETPARQVTMRGYPDKVDCLAWRPRSTTIATAGGADVVLWDMPTTRARPQSRPLHHHQARITTLAWSGDGNLLGSGDNAGQVAICNPAGDLLFRHGSAARIKALHWQPGGHLLGVGDAAGGLCILDCSTHPGIPAPRSAKP